MTALATTYSVSTLPTDHPKWPIDRVLVIQDTNGTWTLSRLGAALMRSGEWEHRPAMGTRADRDRYDSDRVRLPLEEALARAEQEADQ